MKKMIILLGCVGCMMLSCSKDPQDTNSKQSGNNVHEWEDSTLSGDAVMGEMKFSVNNVMSVERQGSTRSTTEYDGTCAFSEGDRIAIRVSRSSVVEDVKLYEVQLDGSLECLDTYPFTWRSLSDAVDIQAWSYGDASTTKAAPEDSDYSLETNQQTNGYRELLYCNAPSTGYSANSITLNFYHQLARVVFNVNHDATGTLSISSQTVGNTTSFPKTAVFSVPTGNNTVGTWNFSASTYGTIIPKTESTQTGYQATYSAVIFPKTYAKSTQFFTVNNSDGDYVYNISENAGFTPTAGNQYNYTVTVKDGNSVGQVICSDGSVYATVSAATSAGKTAVAMIAYIGSKNNAAGTGAYSATYNHGLAVALTDVKNASGETGNGGITWANASTACANYQVSAPSNSSGWFLASIYQWNRIFEACGGEAFSSSEPETNAYLWSYGQFRALLDDCGGTPTEDSSTDYWTATSCSGDTSTAWGFDFHNSKWYKCAKTGSRYVRAVFVF